MIKECKLVANTEVPKFDVHEWRKQRDMDMFGQVMFGLLPHVIAQVTYFYHLQMKLQEGNVFTPVCVSVHKVGIYPIACWDTHPLCRHNPPGRQTHLRQTLPWADTPPGTHLLPGQTPPSPGQTLPSSDTTGYGQQAAGMHPTGIHTCYKV